MRLSVVIPTHNRKNILKRALECFVAQDFSPSEFEVIVVDDGSGESPEAVVRELAKIVRFPLSFYLQKKSGQGTARNLGVKEAKGEIVILIGDDIFVTPDFLKEHDVAHRRHAHDNEAVLGRISWHPELAVSPLMEFMTRGGAIFGKFGGHQFAFDRLSGKEEADYRFFYTSNISLKRKLLLDNPFDPWFSSYGWEDIELGYRLAKNAGLRIFYNPAALAHHYHPISFNDFENRMRAIGRSSALVHKKYPELLTVPSRKKMLSFRLLSSHLSIKFLRNFEKGKSEFMRNLYYFALSKKYFLEGLREEA